MPLHSQIRLEQQKEAGQRGATSVAFAWDACFRVVVGRFSGETGEESHAGKHVMQHGLDCFYVLVLRLDWMTDT